MLDELFDSKEAKAGRFLSFRLSHETYAIPIENISEIIGVCEISYVPNTPPFLRGVIDLHGKVIPVVDLRIKFGMTFMDYNKETCIIIVETPTGKMGVVVDTVNDLIDLSPANIEVVPQLGDREKTKFISGMGKHEGKILILVNIALVLSLEEKRLIKNNLSAV